MVSNCLFGFISRPRVRFSSKLITYYARRINLLLTKPHPSWFYPIQMLIYEFHPIRLTPNLWSQPFSRSYGSNLPTSLTYINLSSRGCSPWVPVAEIGTVTPHPKTKSRPRFFPHFSRDRARTSDSRETPLLFAFSVRISV